MTPQEDTPRSAFALLSWRINLVVVVALVAVSVLAWRSTVEQANAMSGMVMGLGQIGIRFQGTMSAVYFLVMWVTMMVAMMLPTVAPMVLAHLAVARRRRDGPLPTIAFVGGYLLVWAAIGVVPLVAYWGFAQLTDDAAESRWLPALAGTILIVAGAYQFTGWKRRCLDRCLSPFAFVVTHDFGGGVRSGAARRYRSRRVLPGLLLGGDGRAGRRRAHEPALDVGHVRSLLRRKALEARHRAGEDHRHRVHGSWRHSDRTPVGACADLAMKPNIWFSPPA